MRYKILLNLWIIIVMFIFSYKAFGLTRSLEKGDLRKRFKAKVATIACPFIENKGQVDKRVAYYARTFGGTVFVTRSGKLVYSLPADKGGVALREIFIDAKGFNVRGEDKAETKVSYFRGRDRSKWIRGLSTYNDVDLGEVWCGVRVKVRAYGKRVEKLFYVEPGSDVREIRVEIKGAKGLQVAGDGRLRVVTEKGDVYFTRPIAYQEVGGKKRFVDVAYVVEGKGYGFKVGEYDHTKPLIIDPLLASTYLGGNSDEYINAIALDSAGNVYVAGYTWSSDYPVTDSAYDTIFGGYWDGFISKFDSNLTTLYASTYLGGSDGEVINVLAFDSAGNVYVAGETYSSDFPVTDGAYDTIFDGEYGDGFISKFDGNLTILYVSTFLGGSDSEGICALAFDSSGNVYVAGWTYSSDFPVTDGAYDTAYGGWSDGFISKFDGNLTTLYASTYLGGSDYQGICALALDSSGNIYVAGWTSSSDFPVTDGAYDTIYNGYGDSFISKLDGNLTTLYTSTYLGGSDWEGIYAIALDSAGNIYVGGGTGSSDFPVTDGAYDITFDGYYQDGFISKFDGNLTTLYASTFLGGSSYEGIDAMAFDSASSVYVAGYTWSSDFPVTDGAYDTIYNGYGDSFISKLDGNLTTLYTSTYLGGSDYEEIDAMAFDSAGNVYVTGWTWSSDFPVTDGAYDTTFNGGYGYSDTFISKLDSNLSGVINQPPVINSFNATPTSGQVPLEVVFTCNATDPDGYITAYGWDFDGDGEIDSITSNGTTVYTYEVPGTYNASCTVVDNDNARTTIKPITITVTEAANEPPEITSFSVEPTSGNAPLEVTFTCEAYDPDGYIVEYRWDFGDGNTDNTTNGTITHTYENPGTYNATCTVVDDDNATARSSVTITVTEAVNEPPEITSFSADPETGYAPLEVTFTCEAQDQDGSIVAYEWDFGGAGSFNKIAGTDTVVHTYEEPGTYNVTCKVIDDEGASDSRSIVIKVISLNEPPEIRSFKAETNKDGSSFEVTFTCEGQDPDGYIDKYEWDFDGDGRIDEVTGENYVVHEYEKEGVYYARVKVVDNEGGESTVGPVKVVVGQGVSEVSGGGCSANFGNVAVIDVIMVTLPLVIFLWRRGKRESSSQCSGNLRIFRY